MRSWSARTEISGAEDKFSLVREDDAVMVAVCTMAFAFENRGTRIASPRIARAITASLERGSDCVRHSFFRLPPLLLPRRNIVGEDDDVDERRDPDEDVLLSL